MSFSFKERQQALNKFKSHYFDLLIIGGGITGAAAARDAATRGLSVALIDKNDFAFGTSSRSSKLIHGGLRYLENFEFGLVYESLRERAWLLKTVPHIVKPLPFYLPVYRGDKNGKFLLNLGLYLYDLLAIFKSPGMHRNISARQMLDICPFLKQEGLRGGFKYYDATMWDDAITVETLRSASASGAFVANYIEACSPIWENGRIAGFKIRDKESKASSNELEIRAKKTIICAGPWTDLLGASIDKKWNKWLSPSRGIHLIFDFKRLPVPGAVVMTNQKDGRISFVVPRSDFGQGVVIVGTTDGPSASEPEKTEITKEDVDYLLTLLNLYFPNSKITVDDVLTAYVGVRPLVRNELEGGSLQKVSREERIDYGPGGTIMVAGGKYTTHRAMAEEIIDFTIKTSPSLPFSNLTRTREPINTEARVEFSEGPTALLQRYGGEAREIIEIEKVSPKSALTEIDGFPMLCSQLRYAIRHGMVLHLEDFYFRRTALFLSCRDHGLKVAPTLAKIWAEELGADQEAIKTELDRLYAEVNNRDEWREKYHS